MISSANKPSVIRAKVPQHWFLPKICYNRGAEKETGATERGRKRMKKGHLQTMQVTFEQICAGERPWTALGNFMNYWYAYAKDRREALIADALLTYNEHLSSRQKPIHVSACQERGRCRP